MRNIHFRLHSDPPLGLGTAMVTGASSGIGAAFARRLARDGHDLILVARRKERLDHLAEELSRGHSVRAEVLAADLASELGIRAAERALARAGRLALLVNNAGFGARGAFAKVPVARLDAMNNLQVRCPSRLIRAALPGLLAERGSIINVSSLVAFLPAGRYVAYAATKAYLVRLSEGLSAELGHRGVRVQALCPGLTRTEFLEAPEYRQFRFERIPAFAWQSADEVVAESLAALSRGGVICIPGRLNRAVAAVARSPLAKPWIEAIVRRFA